MIENFQSYPDFQIWWTGEGSRISPQSILPVLSKVFEKVIHRRLIKLLNLHNKLTDHQFVFRSKLNTSEAIVQLLDNAYHCLDNKKSLIAVFYDFSKSSDTVNRYRLMKKCMYTVLELSFLIGAGPISKTENYMDPYVTNVRAYMIWIFEYRMDLF